MAPLSFEPLAEASFSLFSQFPAVLPGEPQTHFRCGSAVDFLLIAPFPVPEEKQVEVKPQEVEARCPALSGYW